MSFLCSQTIDRSIIPSMRGWSRYEGFKLLLFCLGKWFYSDTDLLVKIFLITDCVWTCTGAAFPILCVHLGSELPVHCSVCYLLNVGIAVYEWFPK